MFSTIVKLGNALAFNKSPVNTIKLIQNVGYRSSISLG